MSPSSTFRLIFVLYCAEAGLFLFLAPWLGAWSRLAELLPWPEARWLFLLPLTRGAVSAFGAVHFVWIAHDVDIFFRRPRPDELGSASAAASATETARGQ